jgi:hypothetical protein
MAAKPPQEQINIRLDVDLVQVLEAAAFVEHASVSELARGAVSNLARGYASDKAVQSALTARRLRDTSLSAGLAEQG